SALRLKEEAGRFGILLGPLGDLLPRSLFARVVHPAVGPMAVRTEHGGPFRRFFGGGSVQVAGDVMARKTGEGDLFNRVPVALNWTVDRRRDRAALGHRPKAEGHLELGR